MNKTNNKKCLAVLSTAAVGVLIASAVTTTAHAAVKSYITDDGSKVIKFDLTKLVADYQNKLMGVASPMFDEYLKDAPKLTAFEDDKTGYVDAQYVIDAYTTALANGQGQSFRVDTVTEAATAANIKNVTVGYEAQTDGTVKAVTPAVTVSSVSAITVPAVTAGTVPTLPSTVQVTLSDGTTATANITWSAAATSAATYATAGTVTVNGTLADYNNTPVSATVTVNATTLGVSSVSAVNADQIAVVFNQVVDKTTAENVANYSLNGTSLYNTPGTDATATLQSDGVTVILKAGSTGGFQWNSTPTSCTLKANTGYVLTIDGVKSSDLTKVTSNLKTTSFNYNDTIAPSVASVTSSAITGTNQVTVKFSEPVTGVGLYTINGKTATYSTPTQPTDTIVLTSADSLVAGKQYSFSVINEKDSSGNLLATNPYSSNFTVTADSSAPTILSASTVGDNVVRVTFSKKMNATTLTSTSNIKLLNQNGSDINGSGVAVTITATANDTTGTQFDVTVSDSTPGSGAAKALFNSTTYKLPLTAVFTNSIKDSIGNAMVATSQPVTLVLDQTKPTITSVQYIKAGATYDGSARANGAIVLTFSKALSSTAPTLATTDYKAITDAGVDETSTVGSLTGSFKTNSDNKVLILAPATALAGTDSETVRFNSGVFTDNTLGANTNDAVVETVDLKNGTNTSDTTAPVIGAISATGDAISVNMGEAISGLDTSTVLNVANYRLNGAPMPSGTYITVSGNTATLSLPAESIATTTSYAVTVTGIKDAAGNVASTAVGNVTLADNTKPVMSGLTFNADGTMTIAFSENVSSAAAADFIVKVNGTQLTATTQYTVAPGVGADSGKVVVTFISGAPVSGDAVSVTTAGTVSVTDGANTAKTGVTVSATK